MGSLPAAVAVLAVAVVAVVGGACRRVASPTPASGNDGGDDGRPPPVAVVGGQRVSKAELSDFVYDRFRDQWVRAVDLLLDERLAEAEARRQGVAVPAAVVEKALSAEVDAREAQSRLAGTKLADTVRAAYGLDPAAWRERVLRPRVASRLLLERVVRRSSGSRDQVVCRVLVAADGARARALVDALARGADFGLLAAQDSSGASRGAGGLLPPIARGDLVRRDVEDRLFAAAVGAVVGPVEVPSPRGVESHVYKVVERIPAWAGDPAAVAARLEEDLVRAPVTRAEVERWAARARREQGVRLFAPDGSPLVLPE